MWRVLLVILLLAIVAGINYLVIESLCWWGYFQTTYNHSDVICRKLNRTERGSKDIRLIPGKDQLALISSGLRDGEDNSTEGMFLFNMDKLDDEPEKMRIVADGNLKFDKLAGMDLWTDDSGDVFLYVINHPGEHDVVDKFSVHVRVKELRHQRRIESESDFVKLYDLAVVEEDKFYFTNMRKYCYIMEIVLRVPFGSIGFNNGNKTELVEEDLFIPTGLALSGDKNGGRFLYVGMLGDREIRIYSIQADYKLKFNSSIQVSTSVANLFVDGSGAIWFAAMPVLHKTMHYRKHPTETACPSQIMRVNMLSKSEAGEVKEVYSNDGSLISSSSAVVVHGGDMLIGTPKTDAYFCKAPQQSP